MGVFLGPCDGGRAGTARRASRAMPAWHDLRPGHDIMGHFSYRADPLNTTRITGRASLQPATLAFIESNKIKV